MCVCALFEGIEENQALEKLRFDFVSSGEVLCIRRCHDRADRSQQGHGAAMREDKYTDHKKPKYTERLRLVTVTYSQTWADKA